MLVTLIPAIIGYAVIANIGIQYPRVKYGMTFLMATGLYSGVPCVLVWNSNNSAGHYKRATTSALQLMIANSGGFVAGELICHMLTAHSLNVTLTNFYSIHISCHRFTSISQRSHSYPRSSRDGLVHVSLLQTLVISKT
jgi:hypothetical protein